MIASFKLIVITLGACSLFHGACAYSEGRVSQVAIVCSCTNHTAIFPYGSDPVTLPPCDDDQRSRLCKGLIYNVEGLEREGGWTGKGSEEEERRVAAEKRKKEGKGKAEKASGGKSQNRKKQKGRRIDSGRGGGKGKGKPEKKNDSTKGHGGGERSQRKDYAESGKKKKDPAKKDQRRRQPVPGFASPV